MRLNFKKIGSVLASAAMLASTAGFAAAASYPAPFVVSGESDGVVVVGANAAATDWAAAVDISRDLSNRVSVDATGATVSGGAAKSLASGSDLVYLNDELNENVQTVTDTDLPTALADDTFTDDAGTDYDYEHTVIVGDDATNGFAFSNSNNDLDDPELIVAMGDDAATEATLSLVVTFKKALNFTGVNSEGEEIMLFGKKYTIGTATDMTSIVLLGGAGETTINVGESTTVDVSGTSYEVSLNAISDAATPEASVTVNGATKNFAQGTTKKVGGVDVFADTVFRSADNQGYVILQLGSDKLTLTSGNEVAVGSDNDNIEGTLVTITGGIGAVTKLEFNVSAPDNDEDFIQEGGSFVDPIFGAVSLDFVDVKNGPELDKHVDTSSTRKQLKVTKEGNNELGVSVITPGNSARIVPFSFHHELQSDNSEKIHVVENETMIDEEYFFLNSGDKHYFMQLKKVSLSEASKSDVHFKDVIKGTTYTDLVEDDTSLNETAGTTTTFSLGGQTFTVEAHNATAIGVYTSDFAGANGNRAIYPYLELVDGEDHRVAWTENLGSNEVADVIMQGTAGKIYQLPSGTIEFNVTSNVTWKYRIDAGTWTSNATTGISGIGDTYTVGTVRYVINTTWRDAVDAAGTSSNMTVNGFAIEAAQSATAEDGDAEPGLLFVEEEDKTETTTTTKNSIFLPTANASTATYIQASAPVWGSAITDIDSETFDDSDFVGYLTNFGSYVVRDSSDSNQALISMTYPATQMYAEVFVSEAGSAITPGSSGVGGQINVVKDSEVSSVSNMNLLVVGGSCVNAAAAKILGSDTPLCTDNWVTATNAGPGQYIIKSVASPYNAGKTAVLVAGYNAADTINAVGKAKEGVTTDSGTQQVYPIVSA